MNDLLYKMIFKRKSFHFFNDAENKISDKELSDIYDAFKKLSPLISDIRVDIKIVSASETNCKRKEEYCILIYSETKDDYLKNIGYIGEQLDLYLVSKNIGTLWYGIGKTEEKTYNGLSFVIMIAIKKMSEDSFRKDMFKSKRKSKEDIWIGNDYLDIANIVRFAPSACNTQPWKVKSNEHELEVYRYKKPGKRGIMPVDKVIYYNQIDIGIFLLFLETCLNKETITFKKEIILDSGEDKEEVLVAKYYINS